MGTRSLTILNDEEGEEIAVIYRQFDGYPDGHGFELANFLANKKIVNGIGSENDVTKIFNGAHCMAAAIVGHLKNTPGNIYLHPAGTRDHGEDYIYTINPKLGKEVSIKCEYGSSVYSENKIIFNLPASKAILKIESLKDEY